MCRYKAVSFRLGSIVEAVDCNDTKVVVDVKSARAVGKIIDGNVPEYLEEMISASRQYLEVNYQFLGSDHGKRTFDLMDWEFSFSDEKSSVSARFAPGLVLDFPAIILKGVGFEVRFRSCLTVCIGDLNSKIWTRAVVKLHDKTNEIPPIEVKVIHDFLSGVCGVVNLAIKGMYERDFASRQVETVKFKDYGDIHIFAVDCEGAVVEENIEVACDAIAAEPEKRLLVAPEIAGALRDVTKASAPSIAWDVTGADEGFRLSDDALYFPHRAQNGAGSVFVTCADQRNSYFSGVVNSNEERRPPRHGDYPNSTGATAEVATFIGRVY